MRGRNITDKVWSKYKILTSNKHVHKDYKSPLPDIVYPNYKEYKNEENIKSENQALNKNYMVGELNKLEDNETWTLSSKK